VVAEVSMTVVLLIAAGLLLRSYAELSAVEIGFPAEGLLVAETPLSPARYADSPRRPDFVASVLGRLEGMPGVRSAGYVNYLPLTFPGGKAFFLVEGRPAPTPQDVSSQMAVNRVVSPRYLATLGVPLLRGRHFDERDGTESPPAVIIKKRWREGSGARRTPSAAGSGSAPRRR
jgi:putative ABC transport system permease protein